MLWILFFALNEHLPSNGPHLKLRESLALLLFPIGVCVGLLLARKREVLGGILSLAFLGSFYFWELLRPCHSPSRPFALFVVFFLPVAAPGLVFVVVGLLGDRDAASAAKSA
jgi:hypothetical protein